MRIHHIALIALFFTFLCNFRATAQTITVSGTVSEQATKAALPYVNVILKTENDSAFVTGTVTDEAGRYTLASVRPGSYLLEFSIIGYATQR